MNYTLLGFQRDAAIKVLEQLDDARSSWVHRHSQRHAVGLAATTGAGKTVIATAIIEAILKGSEDLDTESDPTAAFLWITDQPALNRQTADKMFVAGSDLRLDDLVEIETTFTEEKLSPGRVYFLNTQKLGIRTDLAKRGPSVGRPWTFWDIVRKTIEDPEITLYLVIDEAHRGMTEGRQVAEANTIIQRFIYGYPDGDMPAAPIVLGISATPDRFAAIVEKSGRTVAWTEVPALEVRKSGLIKDRTIARYAGERQTDAMALFPEAVRIWKEAGEQWATYHAAKPDEKIVVPALVIQVENEANGGATQTDLAAAIRTINEIAGPLPESAYVHAFGEQTPEPTGEVTVRYVDPPKIAGDLDARVIFFKMGLGTGWDCPRAEVLFIFRRSVDPTTIAQTIGRMVRSPLARRIEERESLNSAYVFLPHYDEHAVNAVVRRLNESGNAAVGEGVKAHGETLTLHLRENAGDVVAALNKVPSYDVPAPRRREAVRVLADLANFLARNNIDLPALKREIRGCADVLVRARTQIGDEPRFARDVDDQAEIIVRTAVVLPGAATVAEAVDEKITATEESINRVFAAGSLRITGEVASTYVRLRLGQDATTANRARLEVYALTGRENVMGALTRHATARIDALRQKWGPEVEALGSAAKQTQYRRILRQAPTPSGRFVKVPEDVVADRGTVAYAKYLFVDDTGHAPIKFASSWERETLPDIIADPTTVAWVRNPSRSDWGLCLSRREGNDYHPFFPDFLVVRDDGDRLVVDIVDPHDHTRPDAIEKAKGLSWYAARHAEQVRHVDLVAKVENTYRTLHMERTEIRAQVDALGDNTQELKNLLIREG